MDEVKVSVCMLTYNHERFIAQAVESALAQKTTFPFEIVIGEDCSTDSTRTILQELARRHPPRIRLLLAESNQGMMDNFLKVFGACRGQYIAFLDGDDYWTNSRKLQIQAEAFETHPEWAICFHPAKCVFEDGLTGAAIYPECWTRHEASLRDLFAGNFMATGAVMCRNRLFAEFPTWFRKLKLGDWPLHILNAAFGGIGFLPEVMSVYRIHTRGAWSGQGPSTKYDAIFEMLSAVDHHFAGKYSHEIDQYRLAALHWLEREVEFIKSQQHREVEFIKSQQHSLSSLQAEHDRLVAENQKLRQFSETRNRSVAQRMAREIARPVRQLRNLLQRWRPSLLRPQPATVKPSSKAA